MARSILVTGGAGYIGSHAVRHLMDNGDVPIILDDLSTGHRPSIPQDIALYEGNVGDPSLLEQIFSENNITAVMHFAGSIVVPESVENPGKYYANNTANTLTLLRAMVKAGVKNLVFSSTAAVYGNPEPELIPIKETTPKNPINPYGLSKLMSEYMIDDMAKAHDLNAVKLRYFNVAGADAKGRVGQSTPKATHLIKVAAEVLTGKRKGMSIFGTDYNTPDGTCIRDYIHIDDLIGAHMLAVDYLLAGGETVSLNCGYGHGYSVSEVINAMNTIGLELGDGEIAVALEGRRAGDPEQLIADSSACRKALGWTPENDDLMTIVRSALMWEKTL